jgi:hypothetical protein
MTHPLDECRAKIIAGLFELRVGLERNQRLLTRLEAAAAQFCDLLDAERESLTGDSEMLDDQVEPSH